MNIRRAALAALVNKWLVRGDSLCASELEQLMSDVKSHGFADFPPEEHRRISAHAGRRRMAGMTADERSALGRHAAAAKRSHVAS